MQTDKLTVNAEQALVRASQIAFEYKNQEIQPEHLLFAMLENDEGLVTPILKKLGVNPAIVQETIGQKLQDFPKVYGENLQCNMSGRLSGVLKKAMDIATKMNDEYVSVDHIFIAQ